jgi:hypothetical protein
MWLEPQMESNYEITGFGLQSHASFLRSMVPPEPILSVFSRTVLLSYARMLPVDPNVARVPTRLPAQTALPGHPHRDSRSRATRPDSVPSSPDSRGRGGIGSPTPSRRRLPAHAQSYAGGHAHYPSLASPDRSARWRGSTRSRPASMPPTLSESDNL